MDDVRKYKELKPEADEKLIECCLYYINCDYDAAEGCVEQIVGEKERKRMQILLHFKQMRLV